MLCETDLAQFVKLLPTPVEITKFKDRLSEYNMESFSELKNIKKPFTLKQLGRPEEFIIRILQNESVIEKAQIILTLIQNEEEFNNVSEACEKWMKLKLLLVDCPENSLFK